MMLFLLFCGSTFCAVCCCYFMDQCIVLFVDRRVVMSIGDAYLFDRESNEVVVGYYQYLTER